MREQTQSEFLHLPFQEKLEFLYGLPARQKRDLILSAPEAERLVQSFAPETLFYTLKEIGSADAGDLLSMAAPEQVKGLFDLDCWSKDRVNFARMREWIEAMAEAGRRHAAEALMELDIELVTLLLRLYLKVYRLDEVQTAQDVPSDRVVQFDEHYAVEFIRYDNILPFLQEILEEMFERDYDYFSSLMDEVYWGVDAELEEQAYQYRIARLSDRGFPDFFEAQSVFGYLDPRKFDEIRATYAPLNREDALEGDAQVEMAMMAPGSDSSLFNAALTAGFAAQGKRQIRSEMALVANQVLVARAIDFGDPDAVRDAIELTHHYLNLGLEHLAGGDLKTAIDYLRETHLKMLLRLGVSLTIDLRKRAEALVKSLGFAPGKVRSISYLDSPYREALEGFLLIAPRFYGGLDREPSVVVRDFKEMRDLHIAYGVLAQLEAMAPLFAGALAVDITSAAFRGQVAGREIHLSQILLTALVNQALDAALTPIPIAASRLSEVRRTAMTPDTPARLTEGFRRMVADTLSSRLEKTPLKRTEDFVRSCLNMLEEEFSEIKVSEAIDPRYISTLLLRAD
ncbi:MAG TPA: DUF6178 family protein [Candidatus Binataceae bacterium]|jgi:hypothetical protein|nr:DUF6178 family protein [Candidatus Binataceae bacterium]